ncbi:hypothetical protein EJ08DRAFT_695054 [Tothia fuscella]|uniref:Uncharacterized protein n=1 Tax=Tothia fuscella TaxID=1048955 RepID=A0A9P4TZZ1_9PEZI|nr:hypothetical protein EJ08DRAFT_695054 [Tothia fuscella]
MSYPNSPRTWRSEMPAYPRISSEVLGNAGIIRLLANSRNPSSTSPVTLDRATVTIGAEVFYEQQLVAYKGRLLIFGDMPLHGEKVDGVSWRPKKVKLDPSLAEEWKVRNWSGITYRDTSEATRVSFTMNIMAFPTEIRVLHTALVMDDQLLFEPHITHFKSNEPRLRPISYEHSFLLVNKAIAEQYHKLLTENAIHRFVLDHQLPTIAESWPEAQVCRTITRLLLIIGVGHLPYDPRNPEYLSKFQAFSEALQMFVVKFRKVYDIEVLWRQRWDCRDHDRTYQFTSFLRTLRSLKYITIIYEARSVYRYERRSGGAWNLTGPNKTILGRQRELKDMVKAIDMDLKKGNEAEEVENSTEVAESGKVKMTPEMEMVSKTEKGGTDKET